MVVALILFLCAQLCNSIAGMLNALMDMVGDEVAFGKSIFSNGIKYNPFYWSKVESAKINGFRFGMKRRSDAWHDAKSGMIIFDSFGYLLMLVSGIYTGISVAENGIEVPVYILVVLVGGFFTIHGFNRNLTFNLFYNRIFKKRS